MQSTLTEASPIGFVHCILRMFLGYQLATTRWLGALRRLVVTTLYVLYSLMGVIYLCTKLKMVRWCSKPLTEIGGCIELNFTYSMQQVKPSKSYLTI